MPDARPCPARVLAAERGRAWQGLIAYTSPQFGEALRLRPCLKTMHPAASPAPQFKVFPVVQTLDAPVGAVRNPRPHCL